MPPKGPPPQIPSDFPGPMMVMAAGLPRCATSTIKMIFEKVLPVGPCMHMNRCLPQPALMQLVHDALLEKDTRKRRALLYRLFSGHAASADFPGHLFIEDIVEMYPDCKIILNVRKGGAKDWEASCRETIAGFQSWTYWAACWWSVPDWWHYKTEVAWEKFVQEKLGINDIFSAAAYDAHNAWVQDVCAKAGRECLVWEPSQGWEPLCKFLNMKVPDEPVPRTNDRAAMQKVVSWRVKLGMMLWAKKAVQAGAVVGSYIGLRAMSIL